MSRGSRGRAAAGVTAMLAAVFAALAAGAGAPLAAQPAPPSRMLPVAPSTDQPAAPELDIAAVYAEEPPTEGSVTFAVQLREPVPEPQDGYRVSVTIGEPDGALTRASLVIEDGDVAGRIETRTGAAWRREGPTTAELDPATGRATIVSPVPNLTESTAVRAEAESASGGEVATRWFSAVALLGDPVEPRLVGSVWATPVDDAATAEPVRLASPGPWVQVVNQALLVGTSDRPPASLLGQEVVRATVFVRISGSFSEATGDSSFIVLDRITGEVQLLRATADGPVPVGGDRSWVGFGLPPDDPGAPTSSSFDLENLGAALGEAIDAPTTSVAADEAYVLADGTTVTVSGVAATLGWFAGVEEEVATPDEPATPVRVTEVGGGEETSRTAWAIGGLALAAVLVAVAIVAGVRRGRRAPATPDHGDASGEAAAPASPEPEPAPPEPASDAAKPAPRTRRDPSEALSALDAELAGLEARVRDKRGTDR